MTSATNTKRNNRIKASEVRVVKDNGEQLGIMPTQKALDIATEQGVDLVEVAPKANPPVCKMMDYGKYQYQIRKKQQEARKKQVQVQLKEIKIRPKTDEHDLQTKIKHVRKFITKGDRCKVSLFFRGREIVHKQYGKDLLKQIMHNLSDIAKVEQEPKAEGKTIHIILAPLSQKQ